MRPRGPRLPRYSALDAMKDILDIRRGVSKQCMGENRKPPARKHMQAIMMLGRPNQRWSATAQKWQRNSLGRVMVCSPRAAPPCIDRPAYHLLHRWLRLPFWFAPMSRQRHMPPIPKYGQIGKLLREAFSKAPLSLSPSLSLPCPPSGSDLMRINCDRQKGRT